MKMILILNLLCWSISLTINSYASDANFPTVGSAWAELKKEPLLNSLSISMAPTWGPALPIGTKFVVTKVYGRWLFGTPEPLNHMKPKDFARPGWIYSRLLLLPGDKQTESDRVQKLSKQTFFHSRQAWSLLGISSSDSLQKIDFLESLVLSENTLRAFSKDEVTAERNSQRYFRSLFEMLINIFSEKNAEAEDSNVQETLGLTGADLKFLDQEFKAIEDIKKNKVHNIRSKVLQPPKFPAANNDVKTQVFSRYLLQKYFELPPLNHEEIDGSIYMRATAERTLRGCDAKLQKFWRNNRWRVFRIYRLKSRPEEKNPWLDLALPGGYFTFSARAIDLASNEAELAFLLIRSFAKEYYLHRKSLRFPKKNWEKEIPALSEEHWSSIIRSQSFKYQANLDVADDIKIDMAALRCVANAGYQSQSAIHYLKKISANKEQSWAQWFQEHNPGIDYRLDRIQELREEEVATQRMPESKTLNIKRFSNAAKQWNLLP